MSSIPELEKIINRELNELVDEIWTDNFRWDEHSQKAVPQLLLCAIYNSEANLIICKNNEQYDYPIVVERMQKTTTKIVNAFQKNIMIDNALIKTDEDFYFYFRGCEYAILAMVSKHKLKSPKILDDYQQKIYEVLDPSRR